MNLYLHYLLTFIWLYIYRGAMADFKEVWCSPSDVVTAIRAVEEGDQEPISLEGESIEAVDEFQYLGSLIASTGNRCFQKLLVH